MQFKAIISILALTSFVAALPAEPLTDPEDIGNSLYSGSSDLAARDGEDKNAYCVRQYAMAADIVTIYGGRGAQGWGLDADGNLSQDAKNQFLGCGALTAEVFQNYGPNGGQAINDNSNGMWKNTEFNPGWYYSFSLPTRRAFNCIGRAVKSAGGPAMKCQS